MAVIFLAGISGANLLIIAALVLAGFPTTKILTFLLP